MSTRTRVDTKVENWDGALGAPAGTVLTLVNMIVPPRAKMRLVSFGNYLSVLANFGKVRWDFYKNGVLIYPYFAIRTQIGYAAQRQPIENVVLEGGSLLQVTITQESGVADPSAGVSLEWEMLYKLS